MRISCGNVQAIRTPSTNSAPQVYSYERDGWRGLVSHLDWAAIGAELRLSPQEAEVTRFILQGYKLAAIATRMSLSLGTVKTYCQRVHQKLGVHDPCELAIAVLAICIHFPRASADECKCAFRSQARPLASKQSR